MFDWSSWSTGICEEPSCSKCVSHLGGETSAGSETALLSTSNLVPLGDCLGSWKRFIFLVLMILLSLGLVQLHTHVFLVNIFLLQKRAILRPTSLSPYRPSIILQSWHNCLSLKNLRDFFVPLVFRGRVELEIRRTDSQMS